MTEHEATALMVVSFFALVAFVCWLIMRYPRSSAERESSVYKWTHVEYTPERPLKPIRLARPPQPNRRKKKKARRK